MYVHYLDTFQDDRGFEFWTDSKPSGCVGIEQRWMVPGTVSPDE